MFRVEFTAMRLVLRNGVYYSEFKCSELSSVYYYNFGPQKEILSFGVYCSQAEFNTDYSELSIQCSVYGFVNNNNLPE